MANERKGEGCSKEKIESVWELWILAERTGLVGGIYPDINERLSLSTQSELSARTQAGQQKLAVSDVDAGMRLDIWLARQLCGLSRSRVQLLIQSGNVTVNGRSVKESHKTRAGERVCVRFPIAHASEIKAEAIPLDVLYQDADIIVINKPGGLVIHPAAARYSGTLVNALLHHCPDLSGIGWEFRPGIVHRLDKDTSGVLVAAKSESALNALSRQFEMREVGKEYLALVRGRPRPESGVISTLIARSTGNRTKMSACVSRGRSALTRYRTIKSGSDISLVLLQPETGRMHQLRVHLAHIGHPVVGDRKYGGRLSEADVALPVYRQMLHAWKLSFVHPVTGQKVEFMAPVPRDMMEIMNAVSLPLPEIA